MLSMTAHDRCDRCGSQAYHVAHKDGRADLLFCNHHYHKYEMSLFEQQWWIETDVKAVESLSSPIDASANA